MKFDKEILQVLCPFGEWNHSRGLQIVDEESARLMKRSATWSSISCIPIYIGHPDENPSIKRPKIVGKIKKIHRTQDGIVVVAAYTSEGYNNITSGKFSAMSPRWQMANLGNGRFRPTKLISVGLTNNPNIPDSGRILSVSNNLASLKDATKNGIGISKRITMCSEKIRNISAKTKKIKVELSSLQLSERLAQRNESSKSVSERKINARRLVDIARERSVRLGEPYTKSFATVKKEIL